MKRLTPRLRDCGTQVQPGGGEWMPVFTLAGFEVWIVHYTCGHGQTFQFRCGSSVGCTFIDTAWGLMRGGKRFICPRCACDKDAVAVWAWINDVRQLR